MRRFRYWLLLPLLLAALAASAALLPHEATPLLTTPESWKVSGDFGLGKPQGGELYTDQVASVYWLSKRYRGDGSGRIVSQPFAAPAWSSLTVMGDLTRPGNAIYFRLEGDGKRIPIRVRTLPDAWRPVTYRLPSDWVGKPVRLIVEAGRRSAGNTFGLSNPSAIGTGGLLASQLRTLRLLAAFVVALLLFLLPGLPVAARLGRRGAVEPASVLPAAIVFSCLAGYLAFWAYFIHPRLGLAFGGAVLFVSAAVSVVDLIRNRQVRRVLLSEEVLTPLTLMGLVGLFFLTLLYAVDLHAPEVMQSRVRFFEFTLAIDNELPYYFANSLYNHLDPRNIFPDWQSSDRPPLQAGLTLLQMPFGELAWGAREYALVAACAFQCAWVPAVWALWRSAQLPRRRAGLALLFVVLSGFALINTVYTWPKLLSAALSVFAVTTVLFGRQRGQPLPQGKAVLIGLSVALAFLSHAGVSFTLLPLGVLLLLPPYYPGLSRLATAGLVFAAAVGPWVGYQTFYDPPGNKLIRQHLAGDGPTWQDGRALPLNLLDAYAALGPRKIGANKLANLRALFATSPEQYPRPAFEAPSEGPTDAVSYRRSDFMALFWSLGILNLGWVVALVKARRRPPVLERGLGVVVPALGLASVFVWLALMFGPGSTVVHQGSYATVLLLFAALAAWLATLPTWLTYLLLLLQGTVFVVGWLLTSPADAFGVPNVYMILLAVYFFAALVKTALRAAPFEIAPAGKKLAESARAG